MMIQNEKRHLMSNPQMVAWIVVIISFILFCMLCAAGTSGTYWFFFESGVNMTVRLTVSQGRIEVRSPDGNDFSVDSQWEVFEQNETLQTDDTSQGYLTFEDNYSKQVIATVFILPNSRLSLSKVWRPRFEWSRNPYEVALNNSAGRFVVQVPQGVVRPIDLSLETPFGKANFGTSGDYRVEVIDGIQMSLLTRYGNATLKSTDNGQGASIQPVGKNEYALLLNGQQGISLQSVPYQVLNEVLGDEDINAKRSSVPYKWACTNQVNNQNEPQGNYQRAINDQRVVLHMFRLEAQGEQLNHAETACLYSFTDQLQIPLDITQYESLEIRAQIKIQGQDVTTCGIQGSECPVMLELTYLGKDNVTESPQVWRHGFYARRPAADLNPLTCDTCPQNHEKLTINSWYIYESGDLFTLMPGSKKPMQLLELRVYSSGHAYDAVIYDLVVIGRLKKG